MLLGVFYLARWIAVNSGNAVDEGNEKNSVDEDRTQLHVGIGSAIIGVLCVIGAVVVLSTGSTSTEENAEPVNTANGSTSTEETTNPSVADIEAGPTEDLRVYHLVSEDSSPEEARAVEDIISRFPEDLQNSVHNCEYFSKDHDDILCEVKLKSPADYFFYSFGDGGLIQFGIGDDLTNSAAKATHDRYLENNPEFPVIVSQDGKKSAYGHCDDEEDGDCHLLYVDTVNKLTIKSRWVKSSKSALEFVKYFKLLD